MKFTSILRKTLKEQLRNYGMLSLTVLAAPFFVFVYYLIEESSTPSYDLVVVSNEIREESGMLNELMELLSNQALPGGNFNIEFSDGRKEAESGLKDKKYDIAIVLPDNIMEIINERNPEKQPEIEFIGDLSSIEYMLSAIWANEVFESFFNSKLNIREPYKLKETSLGVSGDRSNFELYVPGLIIFGIVMLMLNSAAVIVAEAEKKTILRIKMSSVSALEYLSGIGLIQLFVGLLSVVFTILTAMALGFRFEGAVIYVILISCLVTISIIAFSLIIAGFSKSVNQVLIVGNFPLFIFMFFTGAAFPMNSGEMFSIAGYSIGINGVLSPVHAVSALKKVLIMQEGIEGIVPEIICLLLLSIIYFWAGVRIFAKKHMKYD